MQFYTTNYFLSSVALYKATYKLHYYIIIIESVLKLLFSVQ